MNITDITTDSKILILKKTLNSHLLKLRSLRYKHAHTGVNRPRCRRRVRSAVWTLVHLSDFESGLKTDYYFQYFMSCTRTLTEYHFSAFHALW